MEEEDSSWLRAILIIALLAAPAVSLRVASIFVDDPYLQPLGLTAEGLASEGGDMGTAPFVDVHVAWGRDYSGGRTQDGLRRLLAKSLAAQTDRYRIIIQEGAGDRVAVTFGVGANRYGPVSPGRAADALNLAVTSLRMTQTARK